MRKKLSVLVVLASVIVLYAAPVLAADYTFKGYGYGHGIGLCQWGAKGRASAGQNYEQILTHYYQGTKVTQDYTVPATVRVRLFDKANLTKAFFEGENSSPVDFINTDGTYAYQGAVGKWSVVSNEQGLLSIIGPDGTVGAESLASPIIVTNAADNIIVYNASAKRFHSYKGSMYVYSTGAAAFYIVNYVQFEPYYLYGLGEVPSSWPYDSLYAQAIAARSYAIKGMKPQATFDLYDSVSSQMYVGVDKINETSNGTHWGARWQKAIDDTARQVLTYDDKPVTAYYSSSCGGHTENVELAWLSSSPQPYLKGVSDKDSSGKAYCQQSGNSSFSWSASFSKADLESKLGVSGFSGLKVTKTGVSPRIAELEILKSDGSKTTMAGSSFRSKLGLKGTWIYQMGGVFPDVALDYWAAAQITNLVERGVVTGYPDGTFQPEVPVTRSQFAKMLCLALGISSAGTSDFNDSQGHWAEGYIQALAQRGVVGGYPDGTFKPEAQINRAEICAIIARALDPAQGSTPIAFPDIADHWAAANIQLIASNGIVNGYTDGSFKPNASAKRSEVSAIIYRMFGFVQ